MKGIGWFSGGITSAVAIKMILEQGHDLDIFYFETGAHHPDHYRFKKDCEKWFGQKIITVRNKKYASPLDVVVKDKFINGPSGARCTLKLKKEMRWAIEKIMDYDFQIMGYDSGEPNRVKNFNLEYPEAKAIFPLFENEITKNDCLKIVQNAGIELPAMYKLGYNNSNCIGCVKGGMGYWNKIRKDFPEVFNSFAQAERVLNRSCLRRNKKKLFLDELDPEAGRHEDITLPECGVFCPTEWEARKMVGEG